MSDYFNPARRYTCEDVRKVLDVECCNSCHDEWDEGYSSPCELVEKISDGEYVEFNVCCKVAEALTPFKVRC